MFIQKVSLLLKFILVQCQSICASQHALFRGLLELFFQMKHLHSLNFFFIALRTYRNNTEDSGRDLSGACWFPVLIFPGMFSFCLNWIHRWRSLWRRYICRLQIGESSGYSYTHLVRCKKTRKFQTRNIIMKCYMRHRFFFKIENDIKRWNLYQANES